MAARALADYPHIIQLATTVSHDGVLGACDDDLSSGSGWTWSSTASSGLASRLLLIRAELVPEDASVVLLDVIHHVFLPDVDRIAIAELDALDRFIP